MSGRIALVVHGGAGGIPELERPLHATGLARAVEAGWAILAAGGSALDAVEHAVRLLEDDPVFNAGLGAVLRLDGSVELDAAIMDGSRRRAGAVACVSCLRHPITLARQVLERTPHVLIAGRGAEELARRTEALRGDLCLPGELITPQARERLERLLGGCAGAGGDLAAGAGDTVGAVARDREGRLAAATSTGGSPGCLPGRVGDSPLIGCGTFADDRLGAVSCTGRGENIVLAGLGRKVASLLGEGLGARVAARRGLEHLRAETGGEAGVICLDREGRPGWAFTTPWMGTASRSRRLP